MYLFVLKNAPLFQEIVFLDSLHNIKTILKQELKLQFNIQITQSNMEVAIMEQGS